MCKTTSERFLDMKKLSLEEKSIIAYRSDLRNFYEYMKKVTNEEEETEMLKKIKNDYVEDYIHYMVEELNNSVTTINRMITTIKSYGKYLCKGKKIIEFNFADGIEFIKENKNSGVKQKRNKEVLSMQDYNKLIKTSYIRKKGDRSFEFNSARFRFLLSLAVTTGLRIKQMLSIRESDIEKKDGYLVLALDNNNNKTDKVIRVPICGVTLEYYKEYLRELYMNERRKEDYIFVSTRGLKLTPNFANEYLKKVAAMSNIGKNLTFHCCRGSFKTFASEIGMNKDLIDLCGGWKLQGMSEIYFKDGSHLDETKRNWIEKILVKKIEKN